MPIIPGAVMGTALCVLPESPRWLMSQQETEAAFDTITRLRHDSMTGETPRSKASRNQERDELELLHLWSEVMKEDDDMKKSKELLRQRRITRKMEQLGAEVSVGGIAALNIPEDYLPPVGVNTTNPNPNPFHTAHSTNITPTLIEGGGGGHDTKRHI